MTIYYCFYALLGLALILTTILCKNAEKRSVICCWVCFSLLWLLLGLRNETMGRDLLLGSDYAGYSGYLYSYDHIGEMSWWEVLTIDSYLNYERGYILLNKLVHFLSFGSRQIFLAVCAAMSVFPMALVFRKKSVDPLFSFVIYLGLPVFELVFSGLRQAIALGICMIAFLMVEKRKPIPFVLLTLFATQFHYSAWLFLIAYPAYHLRMNFSLRIATAFLIPVVFVLRRPLFLVLSPLLKSEAAMESNHSYTLLLVFFAIYFLCIIFMDDSKERSGLMNLFFLACVCQAFSDVYSTAMRVGYYFMLALPLLLPATVRGMKLKNDQKLVTILISACFIVYSLYTLSVSSLAEANPYQFFWESI